MASLKKFFKGVFVVAVALSLRKLVFAVAIYTAIAVALQTMCNKDIIKSVKFKDFLVKIHLAKKSGDEIVIRTPIALARKVLLWVASDYILSPKVRRFFSDLSAEANKAYAEDASSEEKE